MGLNSTSSQWAAATQTSLALHGALFAALLLGSASYLRLRTPQQGEASIVLTMATSARKQTTALLERPPAKSSIEPVTEPTSTKQPSHAPRRLAFKQQKVAPHPVGELSVTVAPKRDPPVRQIVASQVRSPIQETQPRKRTTAKHQPRTSSRVAISSIARPAGVKRKTKATFMAKVEYPAEALAAGQTGNVTIALTVGANGRVTTAKLFRSCGYKLLDKAGVKAAKSWRFNAGAAGRKVRIVIPFHIVNANGNK